MTRRTTHLKQAGATFLLLLTLAGAAPAYATSTGGAGPLRDVGSSVTTLIGHDPRGVTPSSLQSADPRAGSADGSGWQDGALWVGVLIGILAFGLWGDTVVGITILCVAALADAAAFVGRRLAHRGVERRDAAGSHTADSPSADSAFAVTSIGSGRLASTSGTNSSTT